MNKSLLNLGRVLSKSEQKQVLGGRDVFMRPCTVEVAGGKCCYTIESHITDEETGVDNWVKEKICV